LDFKKTEDQKKLIEVNFKKIDVIDTARLGKRVNSATIKFIDEEELEEIRND
tara:strand:+ start:348 stop:503 length:156 start_codon:yes stop_codon:yes gene_type:complete